MKANKPTFSENECLARYIAPEYRQHNRRAKLGAFMEGALVTKNGLSVNSLEIETANQIAATYSKKFRENRPIALSTPTIGEYNNAATQVNYQIVYDTTKERWMHRSPNGAEESYKHDPKADNNSHCLVRYTRHFDEFQMFRFARRMAMKPTYHLY